MLTQHIGKALVAALVLCSCSPRVREEADVASVISALFVSERDFLSIQDGASYDAVKKTLGKSMRLGFAVRVGESVFTMVSCLVAVGDGVDFWLLFRDGTLTKIVRLPRRELETYLYDGTTATRIRPWDVDDDSYVQEVISVPAMTHDEIRTYINWSRPDRSTKGEPANIMPAFLLSGYFKRMGPRFRQDCKTNQELRDRLDGCRVSLGMNAEQVDRLYGSPLRVFLTKSGHSVRIYGEARHLEIDPLLKFSCLAVVFDGQGQAAVVYGYGFFNDQWAEHAG